MATHGIRYGEDIQVVPLELQTNTAAWASNYVDIGGAQWITFEIGLGTCDTATTLTVEESTANSSNATEAAIPFVYRLSGAVGSDTWGAITTCDSAGFALVATTDSNKIVLIDVDPSTLDDGFNFLRVVGTATNYSTAMSTSVVAHLVPRYKQLDPVSSS